MRTNTVKELMLEQPDGVRLYTVLQLPEPEGKFPLIIVRNPYCNANPDLEPMRTEDTHGYAVLYQHCRGTGKSEGICIPYLTERKDGLFLLDWIRSNRVMSEAEIQEAARKKLIELNSQTSR